MVLYADDTTLIFTKYDRDLLLRRVDSAVESLNEYFIANDLLMNVGKTQTLLFSNRSNDNLTKTMKEIVLYRQKISFFSVFMLIGDWTGNVIYTIWQRAWQNIVML